MQHCARDVDIVRRARRVEFSRMMTKSLSGHAFEMTRRVAIKIQLCMIQQTNDCSRQTLWSLVTLKTWMIFACYVFIKLAF